MLLGISMQPMTGFENTRAKTTAVDGPVIYPRHAHVNADGAILSIAKAARAKPVGHQMIETWVVGYWG
jgi:hypothetical protein